MTIKEQADNEIYWVLKEIQKLAHITPEREYLDFAINLEKDVSIPSPDNQRKILRKIRELDVIKIIKEITVSPLLDSPLFYDAYDIKPKKFYLEITQPQFGKLLEKYEMLTSQPSNTVKFHYSQKIVSIDYDRVRYTPREREIIRVLTEIARHYGILGRDKPCRVKSLFDDYEYQNKAKKLRDVYLPNINRQLLKKGIPLKFGVVGDRIIIKEGSPDIEIKFL